MISSLLTRIARKALALVACTGIALAMTTGAALAGHCGGITEVTIDTAVWDGAQLTVTGCVQKIQGSGSQTDVTVVDGDNPGTVLGMNQPVKKGDWTVTSPTCVANVIAQHDGDPDTVLFPVTGDCGGGGNQPPILDLIGPQSVTEGNDLIFNVTTQLDPDGPTSPLIRQL